MRSSLRQLETLRLFAQTLSVTETARLTRVSQSAVSHTLRELETDLGLKLFQRHGNRLRLTPEGQGLIPEIDRVFTQITQLESRAREMRDMSSGELRVASLRPLGGWLLSEAAARFLAERPRMRFGMRDYTAADVIKQVRSENVDIGFTMRPGDDIGVFLEPFLRSVVICALPEGHALLAKPAITLADLRHERIIMAGADTPVAMALREAFPNDRVGGPDAAEINHSSMALSLVARGIGAALIHPFGLPDPFPGVVIRPLQPLTWIRVMMAFSRNRPLSRTVQSFVATIRDVARKTPMLAGEPSVPLILE